MKIAHYVQNGDLSVARRPFRFDKTRETKEREKFAKKVNKANNKH